MDYYFKKSYTAEYPEGADPELTKRMYNGLDARQGYPVITSPTPFKKNVPWWKKVLGL